VESYSPASERLDGDREVRRHDDEVESRDGSRRKSSCARDQRELSIRIKARYGLVSMELGININSMFNSVAVQRTRMSPRGGG
jgi:hypothetical protein